jgi:hypothetical protein
VVETAPIAFTIAAGAVTVRTFHFRPKKQGTLAIGMEMNEAFPVLTAYVAFDTVSEPEPWLDVLVGQSGIFTWSFEDVEVFRSIGQVATSTLVIGVQNTLTVDAGAPTLLADLLAVHDTVSPVQGESGVRDPLYLLIAWSPEGGSFVHFADHWGYGEYGCFLYLLPGATAPALPVDDDGFAALQPRDVPEGTVELTCASSTVGALHSLFGTAIFDWQ